MDLLFIPVIQNIKTVEESNSNTENEILGTEEPKASENKNIIKHNSTKYVKKFIEKNKDKINIKVQCPVCYSSYTYFNKSKHFKTKRHLLLQSIKNNEI
jgi:hypothetical protein